MTRIHRAALSHSTQPVASTARSRDALMGLALILGGGCAGPDFAFDPAPAPGWTRGMLKVGPGHITATGSTPVTLQTATDFELARRDALHQVAASVQAEVTGHTSIYEAHIAAGSTFASEEVMSHTVDLRTRLPVEGARVVSSYRDEGSASAYVLVEVDTAQWASNVDTRLGRALIRVEQGVERTTRLANGGDVFGALQTHGEIRTALEAVTVDVSVMEVLHPQAQRGAQLRRLADALSETIRSLRERTPFVVQIQGGDTSIQDSVRGQIREFLGQQGFTMATNATRGAAEIRLTLSHESKGAQRVGNRLEHVVAARGSLRIADPRGREVPALAFDLSGSMMEERGTDLDQVTRAAHRLAGQTLVSQFRSRFRRLGRSPP